MLSKVGALHSGNRCQGDPVADITNGPDAVHTTLAEIIHLDAPLVIQLHPQLQGQEGSCHSQERSCQGQEWSCKEARGVMSGVRGVVPGPTGVVPGAKGVMPGAREIVPGARGSCQGQEGHVSTEFSLSQAKVLLEDDGRESKHM